jgi:hypothetical protein
MPVALGNSKCRCVTSTLAVLCAGDKQRCDHGLVASSASEVHRRPATGRSGRAGIPWTVNDLDRRVWIRTTRKQPLHDRLVPSLGCVQQAGHTCSSTNSKKLSEEASDSA